MARCSTYTGLPLDTWAEILGLSPWEFNNCSFPIPKSAQCKDSIYQFPWQKDHLSREEIGQAIANAEKMIADVLEYWPYPHYTVGEEQPYPRPHQRQYYGYAGTPRGDLKTVQLDWGHYIAAGVFNRELIDTIPSGDITALDEDGDGVFETFQAVITDPIIGTITDPYDLALYFADDNRHGEPVKETWRVRPLSITISGNTATFRGHRTLLINPNLEFRVDATPLNPATDANYVTELLCYRTFTDTTATEALPYQGVAQWKDDPGCAENCTFSVKPICIGEHNNANGRVYPNFEFPCGWLQDREPDRIEVNYLSGLALEQGRIPMEMAMVITYLSASLLANEKCGCDRSNRIIAYWKTPIARFEDRNNAGATAFQRNTTDFPMTVGGQYALKRVLNWRNLGVVSL